MNTEAVKEALTIVGLTLLGVGLLIGFGVALGAA